LSADLGSDTDPFTRYYSVGLVDQSDRQVGAGGIGEIQTRMAFRLNGFVYNNGAKELVGELAQITTQGIKHVETLTFFYVYDYDTSTTYDFRFIIDSSGQDLEWKLSTDSTWEAINLGPGADVTRQRELSIQLRGSQNASFSCDAIQVTGKDLNTMPDETWSKLEIGQYFEIHCWSPGAVRASIYADSGFDMSQKIDVRFIAGYHANYPGTGHPVPTDANFLFPQYKPSDTSTWIDLDPNHPTFNNAWRLPQENDAPFNLAVRFIGGATGSIDRIEISHQNIGDTSVQPPLDPGDTTTRGPDEWMADFNDQIDTDEWEIIVADSRDVGIVNSDLALADFSHAGSKALRSKLSWPRTGALDELPQYFYI